MHCEAMCFDLVDLLLLMCVCFLGYEDMRFPPHRDDTYGMRAHVLCEVVAKIMKSASRKY